MYVNVDYQDVVILIRMPLLPLLGPECLSRSGQSDHHQDFALVLGLWAKSTANKSFADFKLADRNKP